jgi:glucan phosphoethanolaminetransferase (alkaline phosphatase superfamily)
MMAILHNANRRPPAAVFTANTSPATLLIKLSSLVRLVLVLVLLLLLLVVVLLLLVPLLLPALAASVSVSGLQCTARALHSVTGWCSKLAAAVPLRADRLAAVPVLCQTPPAPWWHTLL